MADFERRSLPPYQVGRNAPPNFAEHVSGFLAGTGSPSQLLARYAETIERLEPQIGAFATLDLDQAFTASAESDKRYRARSPLSPVDGLPIGIKDVFDAKGLPAEYNSAAFAGWQPRHDSACVHALRAGGAILVGKTATAELAMGAAPPTQNPFDPSRTPGASSSGSAAAVGAGMIPVALGTQIFGSVIRPAGYCGTYALKPSFGAIDRGGCFTTAPTIDTIGALAGTLDDAWRVVHFLSVATGGDPGHVGLSGNSATQAVKPRRLFHLHTAAWSSLPPEVAALFDAVIDDLRAAGIDIVDAEEGGAWAEFEGTCRQASDMLSRLARFEGRWPLRMFREQGQLSESILSKMDREDWMTPSDYRDALLWREAFRAQFTVLRGEIDGLITLSTLGPAPFIWESTGNVDLQTPASALGAPAVSLPVLAYEGLPQGVQLVGFPGEDAELVAISNWLLDRLSPQRFG